MHTTRALLGSLGASMSLVAAGTLALLAVSAILAFKGLPGSGIQEDPSARGIALTAGAAAPQRPRSVPDDARAPIVLPRATASRAAAAGRRTRLTTRRATRHGAGRTGTRRGTPTFTDTTPATTVTGGGSAPAASTGGGSPQPATPPAPATPGQAVRQPATVVGGAVQGTTDAVAETVRPVSPPVA
ncbi:MAG: hypothetical protein HZB46_14485, partial [Solirubrobacterales bacterium]|nr:hypothetical protein [Solirubrobacterales bacterium]